VRALICLGGNPVAAWPHQNRTIEALEAIDLFETLDITMSATAKLAHYVIASKIGLEVPNMSYVTEHMELYAGIWGMSQPFGMYAPAPVSLHLHKPVMSSVLEVSITFHLIS
jgi:anaerobic selenocysteine-containing dehydrogenase